MALVRCCDAAAARREAHAAAAPCVEAAQGGLPRKGPSAVTPSLRVRRRHRYSAQVRVCAACASAGCKRCAVKQTSPIRFVIAGVRSQNGVSLSPVQVDASLRTLERVWLRLRFEVENSVSVVRASTARRIRRIRRIRYPAQLGQITSRPHHPQCAHYRLRCTACRTASTRRRSAFALCARTLRHRCRWPNRL